MRKILIAARLNRNGIWAGLLSLILLPTIGYMDYLSGVHISFSIFYVIPILFAGWFTESRFAFIISLSASLTWFIVDYFCRTTHPDMTVSIWSAFVRLSFFLIIWYLLTDLKRKHRLLKELAVLDPLTGALNPRGFLDCFELEYLKSCRSREPFSLAYFDLDNFKSVNDTRGHLEGNQVLEHVVHTVKEHIRKSDVIGRLGGDEFAILFPGTNDEGVRTVTQSLRKELSGVMRQNDWSVTFSIGVVVINNFSLSFAEIIKLADETMYEVKINGKNNIKVKTI